MMCLKYVALAALMGSALIVRPQGGSAAKPADYTGCVTKLQRVDRYVLAAGDACFVLNAEFKAAEVAGRTVTLRGTAVDAVDEEHPLTLEVTQTVKKGDVCTATCTPQPPGTRGFPKHGKTKPGSEGGPPGLVPKATQPQ